MRIRRGTPPCEPGQRSQAEAIAPMLVGMFSWLRLIFLIAGLPVVAEVCMQRRCKIAVKSEKNLPIFTLCQFLFVAIWTF